MIRFVTIGYNHFDVLTAMLASLAEVQHLKCRTSGSEQEKRYCEYSSRQLR